MRVLNEEEVLQLSGLEQHWKHISLADAERLPETLVRNMCGNCFHPALISSALGNDAVLRDFRPFKPTLILANL